MTLGHAIKYYYWLKVELIIGQPNVFLTCSAAGKIDNCYSNRWVAEANCISNSWNKRS